MIEKNLKGQNILVTGASDGIGYEIACHLMKRGANIGVHYFKNKKRAQNLIDQFPHLNSNIFQADFSHLEEVENLWVQLLKIYGHIDAVILNAGVFLRQPIDHTTDKWFEVWKQTMTVNLDAPGILTQLGLKHFKEKSGGRFIYIASRAVFRGETEEYLAYAASKGGLVSLARSVARSFGKFNIKSFVIAPGFVKTKMAEQFIQDHGSQKILEEIALKEMTVPSDISPLVGLMCSGLMDHATGATIDVNAGSHIR